MVDDLVNGCFHISRSQGMLDLGQSEVIYLFIERFLTVK